MNVLLLGCLGALTVGAALVTVRIARGPTMLDRAIALDVLVSLLVVALAVEAAVNRHTTTLPILVVLSLLAFVGSVALARFVPPRADDDRERGGG